MNKKLFKRIHKECLICKESDYNVLDVHRINPGSNGGKYKKENTICICSNCHRKIHANEIIIEGKYKSTAGDVVKCIIDGKECWMQ